MLDRSRLREKGLILDCGFREIPVHHGREGVARGTGGREGVARGTGEKLFSGGLGSRGGRVYRSLTLGACLHQPGLTT